MSEQADPGYGPPQDPPRIVIRFGRSRFPTEHSLEIADRPHGTKPGFAEVELIAIFALSEPQARTIRRYVMRQQLLTRARA